MQPQVGLVVAEHFSNKAADLICQELGFETSVDWVDYMDEEKYYDIDNYAKKTSYLLISDLHCENKVMKLDDCSYNNRRVTNSHSSGELLPYIILSCNPKPGKIRQLPSVFLGGGGGGGGFPND